MLSKSAGLLAVLLAIGTANAQTTLPSTAALRARVEQLYRSLNISATATADRLAAIARLSLDERRMYGSVLDSIDWLRGSASPTRIAEYMIRVMAHAAAIAGTRGARFVSLTGMAFSRPDGSTVERLARKALGGGEHKAGTLLETAYKKIANNAGGSTARAGFRADIVDKDPQSTVTHHFGEFFQIGGAGAVRRGRAAQYLIDSSNPGDRRNGYFALMLGSALADAKLTPREATNLTRWAFTMLDRSGTPPWNKPYGSAIAAPFRASLGSGYHLPTWRDAFNSSHPASRIPKR